MNRENLDSFSTNPISHQVLTSQSWGQFSWRSLHTSTLMSSMVPKQNGTGQWIVRSMNIPPSWKIVKHGNRCTLFQYHRIFSVWNLYLYIYNLDCISVSMMATPQFDKPKPKLTQWNGLWYDPIWCLHHKFLLYQSIDWSMCTVCITQIILDLWSIAYFFICSRC